MSVLILGLGNLLMTDDGVGIHAVRGLRGSTPSGASVVEVGTAVFDAMRYLDQAAVVIAIDAIDAGVRPGSLVRYELEPGEAAVPPASLHDLDFAALVRSVPPERRPQVTMIGVQPAVLEPGLQLSPIVAASLPALIGEARRLAADQAAKLTAPPTSPTRSSRDRSRRSRSA